MNTLLPPDSPITTITYLTTVEFGYGAIERLRPACDRLRLKRPLLVTDRGIMAAGILEDIVHQSGLTSPVFLDTPENPTEAAAILGRTQYIEEGCDGLIAIGGGSPIDLAKAIALTATHEGPLESYAAAYGGGEKIGPSVAPVIAIPTTAGTGSEVGRGSLIVTAAGRKLGFISPYLIPKTAICDPLLTLGLPAHLTAATGMDAFTHCVETYLSPLVNPPAEAIALAGLQRSWSFLPDAVAHPGNRAARWQMMMAALEGGLTFQKGLGPVHSLSHALGAIPDLRLHHGTLNAVLLPAVLRFNRPQVGDKYAALCRALGLAATADLSEAILRRVEELSLPTRLSAMGVRRTDFPFVMEGALLDHSNRTSPRRPTAEEFAALLEEAY